MKKQQVYFSMAGGLLLIMFISSGYWISQHRLSFTCSSSTVSFASNINNNMALSFTQNMTFSYWGKVVIHLSGEFSEGNTRYVLNRTVVYTYTRTYKHGYSLRVINTSITGSDNVPESLENIYLGSLLLGAHRILRIQKMPTGDILISNNAGPYLICATH